MIKIRNKSDRDTVAVDALIAVATDELRAVYQRINTNDKNSRDEITRIVALIDEGIVGTAEYCSHGESVLLTGLAVSPLFRNQGVAKALTDYILLQMSREGKFELALNTIKETGNVDIFLRMGFSVVSEGISENYKGVNGEDVTLVLMVRKTSP